MAFKHEWDQFLRKKKQDKELMDRLKRNAVKKFKRQIKKERNEMNGLLKLPTERVCINCAFWSCLLSEGEADCCDAWTNKS